MKLFEYDEKKRLLTSRPCLVSPRPCAKRISLLERFPYVCPEPVVVKRYTPFSVQNSIATQMLGSSLLDLPVLFD